MREVLKNCFNINVVRFTLFFLDLVMRLSHAYVPVLKKRTRSFLLNVGSTTCYQSIPYLNIYAASKAFVYSFTRALRFELRNSPVSVSLLIPGSPDTNFVHRARMSEATKKAAERFNMLPDVVARIALRGLFRGKAEIIPGFTNKLHAFFPRFVSRSFTEKLGANIYKPEVKKYNTVTQSPVNLAVPAVE